MPAKTKALSKTKSTTRPAKSSKKKVKKWNEQHKAVAHLMEEELNGIIEYLQTLHKTAIIIILGSSGLALYALRTLFQSDQQAVVGFLTLIVFCIIVIVFCIWVLRPWILPRFLLPLDLEELKTNELMALFSDPEEYLKILKHHIQVLTESFLLPKLSRLRNALIILAFGIAISMLLAIALP